VAPGAATTEEMIEDVIAYLMPSAVSIDHPRDPQWPPDAFAIAAAILKRSGAYRDVANKWPPNGYGTVSEWRRQMRRVGKLWRRACNEKRTWPAPVKRWWNTVLTRKSQATAEVLNDNTLYAALLGIVAAADYACAGFGFISLAPSDEATSRADLNLAAMSEHYSTLCEEVHASRVMVLPKAHNPLSGMTLRSLTHNLALWDKTEVYPTWHTLPMDQIDDECNLLLLPWPLRVEPNAFAPTSNRRLDLPSRVGMFKYKIQFARSDIAQVHELLEAAKGIVGSVEAIIFPELSMTSECLDELRESLNVSDVPILIAGLGDDPRGRFGSNKVGVAVDYPTNSPPFYQDKHHRWRLDERQISNYGIGQWLPTSGERVAWWEAIEIEQRRCRFFNVNEWLTFSVLICEDLARQDPVSEMVRSVGPSLVIALLLDGPQIPNRWSAQYATVLADDPRSSVLTLTSAGMVDLARSQYGGGKRSVGLWKEASGRAKELILEPQAQGLVLKLVKKMETEWTADGRDDGGKTGYLRLSGIYQVEIGGVPSVPPVS